MASTGCSSKASEWLDLAISSNRLPVHDHMSITWSKKTPKQNSLHLQKMVSAVTEMQNSKCEVGFENSTYLFKRTAARIFNIMVSKNVFILPICHWVNNV